MTRRNSSLKGPGRPDGLSHWDTGLVFPLELKQELFCRLKPVAFQTGNTSSACLGPILPLIILGLVSLHNNESQFLKRNLSIYIHPISSFPLENPKTPTNPGICFVYYPSIYFFKLQIWIALY